MIPEVLVNLGLSTEEAEIYLSLLSDGPQSASQLSKSTKVKRTYIYSVSASLIKKGLASQTKRGKTTIFSPMSPDKLLSLVENKKVLLEQTENTLESIMPSLKEKFEAVDVRPVITYYEGENGIKKANLEVLAEKKEILAFLVVNKEIDKRMESFWKKYYQQRVEDNIFVRAITPNTKEGIEYKNRDNEELRETRLVSKNDFPINIEKNIVGNKVAFFSTIGKKLIATIIENKEIADTERVIFEIVWKQAGTAKIA